MSPAGEIDGEMHRSGADSASEWQTQLQQAKMLLCGLERNVQIRWQPMQQSRRAQHNRQPQVWQVDQQVHETRQLTS